MPRPLLPVLLAGLLWLPSTSPFPSDPSDPSDPSAAHRLTWYRADGSAAWSTILAAEAEPAVETTALDAPAWFSPVPDLTLSLHDGTTLDLASTRGNVLILDFWATWCVPCLEELPQLQRLQRELGERGLVAITVNAQEPEELVRSFAEQIGLELPIARYDRSVHEAFRVLSIPTLILADRRGRMRERWNGYSEGLERTIAATARRLLDEGADGAPAQRVAEVLAGAGRFRADWLRESKAEIEAIGAVPTGDGPRILVTRSDFLLVYDRAGRLVVRLRIPEAGRFARADLDGDGGEELVSFRPGAREVVRIDPDSGQPQRITAPAPVLALALLPAGASGRPGRVLLATLDGLFSVDPAGGESERVGAAQRSAAVAVAGEPEARRVLALDPAGRPLAFDGELGSLALPADVGAPGLRGLVAGGPVDAGWGASTGTIRDFAAGRFFGTAAGELALATGAGQLVVLDLASGDVLYRARWDGIRSLAALDLDGDGLDELLVATAGALVHLSAGNLD